MEDYEFETDSDSSKEELESELYSVLHYNSFSGDLPPELLEKYNIRRENNEFFISMKRDFNEKLPTHAHDTFPQLKECDKQEHSLFKTVIEEEEVIPSTSKSPESVAREYATSTPKNLSGLLEQTRNNPNNQISTTKYFTNEKTSPTKASKDLIVIEDEESQDSDVIIQESQQEITYISSSSSVECVSDSDNMDRIMLNTSGQTSTSIFPDVEEIEEVVEVNWRKVSSPKTWTMSMRRYYNKPSIRLKYFDHEKIRQEIKGTGTWNIIADDLFPRGGPRKRCTLCRQTDHLIKNCPKKYSNCSMCGNPDHSAAYCPYRMCLNCGRKSNVFIAMCHDCESSRRRTCAECKQVGHIRSTCPDTWRRFHSTNKGELKVTSSVNEKLMCCNCGKAGHLYENCQSLYWSSYPPSSFLAINNNDLHIHLGKRKPMDGFVQLGGMKKPRWSEPNFPFNHFNNLPNTPKSNKKKKKKKKKKAKLAHFQKNKELNRNNTL